MIAFCCFGTINLEADSWTYSHPLIPKSIWIEPSYYSVLNNPSQMCNTGTWLSYTLSNPYGVRDLHYSGLNYQMRMQKSGVGLAWENESNPSYQKNTLHFAVAYPVLESFQLALSAHHCTDNFYTYGKAKNSNLDLSFNSVFSGKLKMGLLLKNLFQDKNKSALTEMGIGMSYQLDKHIFVVAECLKNTYTPFSFKTSLCLKKDSVHQVAIFQNHGGRELGLALNYQRKKVVIGLACSVHILLGFSSSIFLAYAIKA